MFRLRKQNTDGAFVMLKIVIFKSGLLGDTLVALPALHCLKNAFPDAKITYIWQKIKGKSYVTAEDVLHGSGLVHDFYGYEISNSIIKSIWSYLKLWFFCTFRRFDIGIVLEAQHWPGRRKIFLKLCGIKTVIGPEGTQSKIYRDNSGRLPIVEKISDSLVALLAQLNIDLPMPGKGKFDISLTNAEENWARQWLVDKGFESKGYNRFIAVAIGSNMATKRWPLDSYYKLVNDLIKRYG